MTQQDSRRMRNRHAAIAVLSAVLLWVILGQGQKEGGWVSKDPHDCWGLMEAAGDVKNPGTYLLQGKKSENGCSMPVKSILEAAGGIKGKVSFQDYARLEQEVIPLGKKLLVARHEPGKYSFRLEPLDCKKRLVWGEKLDVNEASLESLSLIPRMRPQFAEAIVARREKRQWNALTDLTEIRGVGPKTVQLWSEYLEAGRGN